MVKSRAIGALCAALAITGLPAAEAPLPECAASEARLLVFPSTDEYYPRFPCKMHVFSAVVKVEASVGKSGNAEDAVIQSIAVIPPHMESCVREFVAAQLKEARFSPVAAPCRKVVKVRWVTSGARRSVSSGVAEEGGDRSESTGVPP